MLIILFVLESLRVSLHWWCPNGQVKAVTPVHKKSCQPCMHADRVGGIIAMEQRMHADMYLGHTTT